MATKTRMAVDGDANDYDFGNGDDQWWEWLWRQWLLLVMMTTIVAVVADGDGNDDENNNDDCGCWWRWWPLRRGRLLLAMMLPPFWTPPTWYKLIVYFLETDNAISLFSNYTDNLYSVLSFSTMISFFHTSLLATLCVLECVSISVTRIVQIYKLYWSFAKRHYLIFKTFMYGLDNNALRWLAMQFFIIPPFSHYHSDC